MRDFISTGITEAVVNLKYNRELRDLLDKWMQGNTAASQFIVDLFCLVHVWDDLIDQDHDLTEAQVNNAFIYALIEMPQNPFYAQNVNALNPVMMNAILSWQEANVLERSEAIQDKRIAFGLRASMLDIISFCALLVGGKDWARECGPDIKRLNVEDWDEFVQEFTEVNRG